MVVRARGSDSIYRLTREDTYGGAPVTPKQCLKMPFVSSTLGVEQPLEASNLLGQGRMPYRPDRGRKTGCGDVVVPVDVYYFGHHLRMAFGPPESAPSVAAQAVLAFTGNPAANSTITLNGSIWTFVTTLTTGNQIQRGANLAATLTAAATALNGSADVETAKCTYVADATTLTITHDTLGPVGNAFTVAVSPTTTARIRGGYGTLKGGANDHVFKAGSVTLPSGQAEIGQTSINKYRTQTGLLLNSINVPLNADAIKLEATLNFLQQNEIKDNVSAYEPADEVEYELLRFTQFTGGLKANGVPLGQVRTSDFTFSNNFDPNIVVREDGLMDGADPGTLAQTGNLVVRYTDDTTMDDLVESLQQVEISRKWTRERGQSLEFITHGVELPRAKQPIEGPGFIQATYAYESAKDFASGEFLTVTLTNDLPTNAYA